MASSSESVLQQLRSQLARSSPDRHSQETVSTGLPLLDRNLPEGGLPSASVVEWVADGPGLRTTSLALKCGAALMKKPGALAVVDPYFDFHATALKPTGISLSRLLLIQPSQPITGEHLSAHSGGMLSSTDRAETLWALEQVSRCSGVRLAVCWIDRLSSTVQRRLQLAVERSGVTVFLIRPASALSQPSWADLRFHLQSHSNPANMQTGHSEVSLQLIKTRNSVTTNTHLQLDWNHETGDVREISELARSGSPTATQKPVGERRGLGRSATGS